MRNLIAFCILVAASSPAKANADDGPVRPVSWMDQVVHGSPDCCCTCSQKCRCKKRCRIVCTMAKKKEYEWVCECEDVCTLAPCKPCGLSHLCACCKKGGCGSSIGCCDGCCESCCRECPKVCGCRTVRRLVKKEYTVEVPIYQCVVEYCCPGCCDSCTGSMETMEASVPGSYGKGRANGPEYVASRWRESELSYGE